MVNDESTELFNSMKQTIEGKLQKAKIKLEKKQERLKDTTKKLSMLDKISINSDIKSLHEQRRRLTELSKSISNLRFIDSSKYTLPNELKSQFDRLGGLLSEQEVSKLRKTVNDSLRNVNKDKKENVKKEVANALKLLKQLDIGTHNVLTYNEFDQYTNTKITFNSAIEKVKTIKLKNLTPGNGFISGTPAITKLAIGDEVLLTSIENAIKKNVISDSSIISNLDSIRESFATKAKLETTLLLLSTTLSTLATITDVDFSKVQSFLKQIEKNYRKELDKTNKYLAKFNFESIKKQIGENNKNEQQEIEQNSKILSYQQLAYELEKVMTEDSNNYERIREIKEAMQDFALTSGVAQDKLQTAAIEGKTRFNNDKRQQEARTAAIKEKVAYETQLENDVMQQIREYAIRELQSSGAFEAELDVRNNDVYSRPIDKEAMIQRKIEELKRLADMSPEQRGLEDQKRNKLIDPNTRLENLTPQQINDLRVAYSDSSYEFMADYKQWKAREAVKPKANNIYKDYIKYRASLNDKTQFLSFSQYAKQLHNIENMSEIMVDEEIKEEMRGMFK